MAGWLQFVNVNKNTLSSNFLFFFFVFFLATVFFSLEFFIFHSTSKEADAVQMERKGSGMKLKLANQTRRQVEW